MNTLIRGFLWAVVGGIYGLTVYSVLVLNCMLTMGDDGTGEMTLRAVISLVLFFAVSVSATYFMRQIEKA